MRAFHAQAARIAHTLLLATGKLAGILSA